MRRAVRSPLLVLRQGEHLQAGADIEAGLRDAPNATANAYPRPRKLAPRLTRQPTMPTESTFESRDDDKIWRELKARLAEAKDSFAKTGIVGKPDATYDEGGEFSAVDLAVVHEFGATINHPGNNYIIVNGLARSVPAGTPGIKGQTPPHVIEIPERSFIRSTFDQLRAEYEDRMRDFAGWIYDGKVSARRALSLMGQLMAKDVRQQIRSDIKPPLAESTMRRKLKKTRPGSEGTPVALIDTGQLINSVTYEVVMSAPVEKTSGANPGANAETSIPGAHRGAD
jgi:hypothetical protein